LTFCSNRDSLYKALGPSGNAEFATVMRVIQASRLTLSAKPAMIDRAAKRRRAA
jgi:DNA-binding phage protein